MFTFELLEDIHWIYFCLPHNPFTGLDLTLTEKICLLMGLEPGISSLLYTSHSHLQLEAFFLILVSVIVNQLVPSHAKYTFSPNCMFDLYFQLLILLIQHTFFKKLVKKLIRSLSTCLMLFHCSMYSLVL